MSTYGYNMAPYDFLWFPMYLWFPMAATHADTQKRAPCTKTCIIASYDFIWVQYCTL